VSEAGQNPEAERRRVSAGRTPLSEDSLLDGRVRLRQPARGYRAAIDPVLLAATVGVGPGESVLDLGCGAGAAALCLLARVPEARVTGLELQNDLAELARKNAALNGRVGRFRVLQGDVGAPPPGLASVGFDYVLLNPPYLPAGRGRLAESSAKAIATEEGAAGLAAWLAAGLRFLRPRGGLAVIHRADRLDELLAALRGGAGEIKVCPLWPAAGRPAKRVLVAARKAVATPLALLPGLVLHQADGRFTPEAEAVLRDAAPIELSRWTGT